MLKIFFFVIFCAFLTPSKGQDLKQCVSPSILESDFKKALEPQLGNLIPGDKLSIPSGLLLPTIVNVLKIELKNVSLSCKEAVGVVINISLGLQLSTLSVATVNIDVTITAIMKLKVTEGKVVSTLNEESLVIQVKLVKADLLGNLLNSLNDVLLKTLTSTVKVAFQAVTVVINTLFGNMNGLFQIVNAGHLQCSVKEVTVSNTNITMILTSIITTVKGDIVSVPEGPAPKLPPSSPDSKVSLSVAYGLVNTVFGILPFPSSWFSTGITAAVIKLSAPELESLVPAGMKVEALVSLSNVPGLSLVSNGLNLQVNLLVVLSNTGSKAEIVKLNAQLSLTASISFTDSCLSLNLAAVSEADLTVSYKSSPVPCGCQNVSALKSYLLTIASTYVSVNLKAGQCFLQLPLLPPANSILNGTTCIPHEGYFTAQR